MVVCICLLTGCESHNEGVSYIKEQESLDTKELSKHLTDKRIEEKLTMVKDGALDVFSMFEDYAILVYMDLCLMGICLGIVCLRLQETRF